MPIPVGDVLESQQGFSLPPKSGHGVQSSWIDSGSFFELPDGISIHIPCHVLYDMSSRDL